MSKIAKRSHKIVKNINSCLVVGDIIDNIETFLPFFNTVFVLKTDDRFIKGRNVVYKEKFNDIDIIKNIDIVFLSKSALDQFDKISNVLTYFRSPVYIDHGEFLPKDQSNKFSSIGFEIVELIKNYQVWKPKK
jgi:phosphatidate phosphatase APP1